MLVRRPQSMPGGLRLQEHYNLPRKRTPDILDVSSPKHMIHLKVKA